jgi:arabinofuranosyltransferase
MPTATGAPGAGSSSTRPDVSGPRTERVWARSRTRRERHRTVLTALLAAALVALAAGIWACWSVTVDDAYITYRYSANLADGFGPTWNPGQDPVEGFTNFAWMLWHAPWVWLGVPLPVVSKLTAAACAAAIVWILVREPRTRSGAVLAAGSFALFLPTWVHVDSGLETAPFALVVLRAVVLAARLLDDPDAPVRRWEIPALLLLAGTLRPDGVLGVAPALLVLLWVRRGDRAVWLWTGGAAVVGAAYLAGRWAYFGHLLPNTFYVKVGVEAATDGRWIQMTAATFLPLLAFAVAGLFRARTAAPAALALLSCSALWFIPALSAPAMDYLSRFAWHGFPVLCLAAAWALDTVELRRVAAGAAVAGVVWTTAAGFLAPDARTLVHYGDDLRRAHIAIGMALADTGVPAERRTLAVTDAGAMPYYSGWRTTDYIGLNDERIAHGASPSEVLLADDPAVVVVTSSSPAPPPGSWRTDLPRVLEGRELVGVAQMRTEYFQLVFAEPDVAAEVRGALDRRLAEAREVTDTRLDPGYSRWVDRLLGRS